MTIIMGLIICILLGIILFIIGYYKCKQNHNEETTATEIVMSSNSNPSVSLPNINNNSATKKDRQPNDNNFGEQYKWNQNNSETIRNKIPGNNNFENEYD